MTLNAPTGRQLPAGSDASLRTYVFGHVLLVPLLLCALAWALRRTAIDVEISNWFFDVDRNTFPWRSSSLLGLLGHRGARVIPIVIGAAALAAAAAGGVVERLRPWRAVCLCLGLSMVLGPLIVDRLKYLAAAHCPADLTMYGGAIDYAADRAAPFFAASRASGGHCVPSGHAGGGYALLSLYFAGWAAGRPRWRWTGLAMGIGAGLLFSLVRLMQGAHFASQTVWSMAIDWTVAAVVFMPLIFGWWDRRHEATKGAAGRLGA